MIKIVLPVGAGYPDTPPSLWFTSVHISSTVRWGVKAEGWRGPLSLLYDRPACPSCGLTVDLLWLTFCRITFSGKTNVFSLNVDFFWGKVTASLGAVKGE